LFIDEELFSEVMGDVQKAIEQARKEDNQYNRRSYVRNVFSAIESFTYMFKSYSINNIASGIYDIGEISLLKEENYRLDSKGKVNSYPRQFSVPENFRFAIEMMMRGDDKDFKIDVSSNGWRHLKNATKTRNRITHPKNIKDYALSSHDMSEVLLAFEWVKYNIMRAEARAIEAVCGRIKQEPGEAYKNIINIMSKYKDI